MIAQKFYFLVFCIFSSLVYCQEKNNPKIIKKEVDINQPIYSTITDEQIRSALADKNYNSKIYVYYKGKFFSGDTLEKIKNIKEYKLEIIKIPDSITKDIHGIIFLKK